MYKVIFEWDLGQDDLMFETRSAAISWAQKAVNEHFPNDPLYELDVLEDEGLFYIQPVSVMS